MDDKLCDDDGLSPAMRGELYNLINRPAKDQKSEVCYSLARLGLAELVNDRWRPTEAGRELFLRVYGVPGSFSKNS